MFMLFSFCDIIILSQKGFRGLIISQKCVKIGQAGYKNKKSMLLNFGKEIISFFRKNKLGDQPAGCISRFAGCE